MTAVRAAAAMLIAAAIYCAIATEAVGGGRTLMPHAPAVVLILAAWSLPASSALVAGAAIGLACDAIGSQPFGPGLIAAVLAAILGSTLRQRWQLASPLAAVLFGVGVALTLIAAPVFAASLPGSNQSSIPGLQIEVARATSSAMAALVLILLARMAMTTKRLTASAWNA